MRAQQIKSRLIAPVSRWIEFLYVWVLDERRALRGLAATRILVGVAVLGILLSNFLHRHLIWGPGAIWGAATREESGFRFLLGLYDGDSTAVFTAKYILLIAIAVAFLIGWRTRVMTLLLVLGMTGLVERADLIGDQGDNILRIGLTLMLFMSTADYWSVDARMRAKGQLRINAGEKLSGWETVWYCLPLLPRWWSALFHNVALIGLACQIFILYTASALYKVQGSLWQDGTALYYPLSVDEYGIFPQLNDALTANPYLLTFMTYFSVYVQLFFAVGLLHSVTRRLFLIGVVVLHGGIAVLMGLLWFSLAMLAFDAIFVSDRTYRRFDHLARGFGRAVKRRLGKDSRVTGEAPQGVGLRQIQESQTIAERRRERASRR